jgi:hypothetical protein
MQCFAVPELRRGIEVPASLRARWLELGAAVQQAVAAFLDPPGAAARRAWVATPVGTKLPASFAEDVGHGAPGLSQAFPRLSRSLAAIELAPAPAPDRIQLDVRVVCHGVHDGTFYGFMQATGRQVRFDEVHQLTFLDGRLVEDRVALDFRAIVRQLVSR